MNRPTVLVPDTLALSPVDHWLDWMQQGQADPLESTSASIAIYDLHDQCLVQATPSVATLLGYDATAIADMEPLGLATLIHPDDLALIADYYQRLPLLRQGEILAVEYRMRHADGSWHWLRSQESAIATNADSDVSCQILSVVQDLTATHPGYRLS